MTHSLHRRGTPEELKNDYILLVSAAVGINNDAASKDKLRQVLEIVWELEPTNIGSNETGSVLSGVRIEEIKEGLRRVPRVRCCFNSAEKIEEIIRRLVDLDLGLSVTISGPIKDIMRMSAKYGVKPHSINFSLDIWGNRDALPPEEVISFVSMCGHGLISKTLVSDTIEKVRTGRLTPEQGAKRIGSPCVCGFFNTDRAVNTLRKYAAEAKGPDSVKGES